MSIHYTLSFQSTFDAFTKLALNLISVPHQIIAMWYLVQYAVIYKI